MASDRPPPKDGPDPTDGNHPLGRSALVVLGLVWGDDGCRVRLRVPADAPAAYGSSGSSSGASTVTPSELVPVVGLQLNYRIAPGARRHCLGHSSPRRNNGAYVDCGNRPQPNERTCVNCAVADAEFASNLHHAHTRERGDLDRSVVDHLEQVNVLYVAAFRDGSLKVGTSTGHRTDKRLSEQGAWRAVQVATVSDGFLVRRLEDLITDKLGLTQSVGVKRKLHGMVNPLSEAMLAERLDPMVQDIHRLIGSLDRLPGSEELETVADSVELTDVRWAFPGSDSDRWDRLHQYPARLDAGTHHLEVAEICGRMAVLTRPGSDDRFVADLGQLFGIELDLGHYQPDPLAIQDSLF